METTGLEVLSHRNLQVEDAAPYSEALMPLGPDMRAVKEQQLRGALNLVLTTVTLFLC